MTIDKIPQPDSEGGGSGGIDVFGEEPIVVTSPTPNTRLVALNKGPPGTFTSFPAGVQTSFARRRIGLSVTTHSSAGVSSFAQTATFTGSPAGIAAVNTNFWTSSTKTSSPTTAAINVRTGAVMAGNPVFHGNVAGT